MTEILYYPLLVLAFSFALMAIAARLGAWYRVKRILDPDEREDFGVILAATLTLLGLIIGFSFSMATSRYDQRKNLEEAEANAIGTELVRAELLPPDDTAKVNSLLAQYLEQRIELYGTREPMAVRRINAETARLQTELWSAIREPVKANPTPVAALVAAGMNDVLNSQGYTQAAWWNRIPVAAWLLMMVIAVACNLLIGFGLRRKRKEAMLLLILPAIVSIAFFLIADIDTPRSGIIRVAPQNLEALRQSLGPQDVRR